MKVFEGYITSQLRYLANKDAECRLRDALAPHAFDGTEAHHAINGALPGIENELVAAALKNFVAIKYRDAVPLDAAVQVMLRLLETGELV